MSRLSGFSTPSPSSGELELPSPAVTQAATGRELAQIQRAQPEPGAPFELDLGSEPLWLDGRPGRTSSLSAKQAVLPRARAAPSSLTPSACTCRAAPPPWPTPASRSPATCSEVLAPRGCTASKPSWDLPRTTGSLAPSRRSRAPGARRSGIGGRARGPPAPRRRGEASSPPLRPLQSTKVSAHLWLLRGSGVPKLRRSARGERPFLSLYPGTWARSWALCAYKVPTFIQRKLRWPSRPSPRPPRPISEPASCCQWPGVGGMFPATL